MTKRFDKLMGTLLTELMPAELGADFGSTVSSTKAAVPSKDTPTYHFKALQALDPETLDKVITSIVQKVFPDKDHTYSADIDDKGGLKDAVSQAIRDTAAEIPEFKPGGNTMIKFLTDRLTNKKLLGNVKFTGDGGETAPSDEITDKQFKDALTAALKQETISKKSDEEAPAKERDMDMVYTKAADLSSDDSDLVRAFKKLPDDEEMSWKKVLKTVGLAAATGLLDAGGLIESPKEESDNEDAEVKDLEFDDSESSEDMSQFDKMIDPYFDYKGSPYRDADY